MYADFFLTALVCAVAVPVMLFAIQVFVALMPWALISSKRISYSKRPTIAVVIPAHNKEKVISYSIALIREQLTTNDQLYVVADNCNDRTAQIASYSGASVIKRAGNVGNISPLQCVVEQYLDSEPDVVVLLEADSLIEENMLRNISQMAMQQQRPVQANRRLDFTHHTACLKQRLAFFIWRVKHTVCPVGLEKLSLPCSLSDTGIAIPFKQLKVVANDRAQKGSCHHLAMDLLMAGYYPMFCRDALVTTLCTTDQPATLQRRWYRDLLIGLVLFTFIATMVSGVGGALYVGTLAFVLFCFSVLYAWYCVGSGILRVSDLMKLPQLILNDGGRSRLSVFLYSSVVTRFFWRKILACKPLLIQREKYMDSSGI